MTSTVRIRAENQHTWKELANKSEFINLALQQAVGLMTWAILQEKDPKKYYIKRPPLSEVIDSYNDLPPVKRLTPGRKSAEWHKNSAKKPELW